MKPQIQFIHSPRCAVSSRSYWIGGILPRYSGARGWRTLLRAAAIPVIATALLISWSGPAGAADEQATEGATGEDCTNPAEERPVFGPVPASLTEARKIYMEGLCRLRENSWRAAELLFRQGMDLDELLRPYWQLRLFHALLPQVKPTQAELVLTELLNGNPQPAMVNTLRGLIDRYTVSAHPGKQAGYHRLIRKYLSLTPPRWQDHGLAVRQWNLSRVFGSPGDRADVLLYLWQTPRTKDEARRWGKELIKQRKHLPITPDGDAIIRRAKRLRVLRLYKENSTEIEQADLINLPRQQLNQLGRIYFQGLVRLRRYTKVEKALDQPEIVARFGFSKQDVLEILVQLRLRRRQVDAAKKTMAQLEAIQPLSAALPGFYLELVRIYHARQDEVSLTDWANRLIGHYPSHALTGEAYWRLTWWHFREGHYWRAVEIVEDALTRAENLQHGERARLEYWRYRALQKLKKEPEAEQALAELQEQYPSSFYALIAAHLKNGGDTLARSFVEPTTLPQKATAPPAASAVWSEERLRPAMFLYSVTESEQAKGALDTVLGEKLPLPVVMELARLSSYYGQYHALQRIVANYFIEQIRTQAPKPMAPWTHAYPQAYWELVTRYAAKHKIHPLFALAIMREESRFDPGVESASGAKGLMQLMPPTARYIAKLQKRRYNELLLLKPEGNIPLGVAYLGRVLRNFKGDMIHAAAAYNAGPTTMKRWLKAFGHLPLDEFIESFPFEETKRYVKRVFGSFLIYIKLYSSFSGSN